MLNCTNRNTGRINRKTLKMVTYKEGVGGSTEGIWESVILL